MNNDELDYKSHLRDAFTEKYFVIDKNIFIMQAVLFFLSIIMANKNAYLCTILAFVGLMFIMITHYLDKHYLIALYGAKETPILSLSIKILDFISPVLLAINCVLFILR